MKIRALIHSIKNGIKYYNILLKLRNKKYTHLYVGSPLHGNLGDQQIRTSAIEFLKDNKINYALNSILNEKSSFEI